MSREIRIKYLPSDKITIEATYNYRVFSINREEKTGIEKQEDIVNRVLKAVVRFSPGESLTLGTRLDYKTTQPDNGKGMLLLQDFNYKFRKVPLSIWFRYCIFKTDGWDTRLYTYENDLYHSVTIPALSGEGNRSYIMIDWKVAKFAELRMKFAFTSQLNEGEDFAETKELKLQVRLWF